MIAEVSTIIGIEAELALEVGKMYLELLIHTKKQGLKTKAKPKRHYSTSNN